MKKLEDKIFGRHFWTILMTILSIITVIVFIAALTVHLVFLIILGPIAFSFWLCFQGRRLTKNQRGK